LVIPVGIFGLNSLLYHTIMNGESCESLLIAPKYIMFDYTFRNIIMVIASLSQPGVPANSHC
jgi:hypothetical protein